MTDWGDGEYEHTALLLEPAATRAVDAAQIARDSRVLDLGCGTGNAALAAARRGARVTAIDPAERLLAVAIARAEKEGLHVEALRGDASQIPVGDAQFDVAMSVFGVIFAPDAERAAAELVRVVRPGGRVVVTSWVPEGAIAEAGAALRAAMAEINPVTAKPGAPWGDPRFLRELFERHGAPAEVDEDKLTFEAPSPEAWFEEQERHHPVWRAVRSALDGADRSSSWHTLRERSIERLRAWNEASRGLRVTSRYWVATAVRAE